MKKKVTVMIASLFLALNFASCGDKADDSTKVKETEDLSRPAQSESVETKTEVQTENKNEDIAKKETEVETDEKAESKADSNVNLSDVRKAMLDECSITDSMMLETDALTRLYGVDASKVKQSASFVTMSGTFPHEIIMIEVTDAASGDSIEALLQNRLSEVLVQSKSYDAKNYALAQQCKVIRNGNHLALFLSPEHEKMTNVYNGYIK